MEKMGDKFHDYYIFTLNNSLSNWDKSWILSIEAKTEYGNSTEVSTFDNTEFKDAGCAVALICNYLDGVELQNNEWIRDAILLYLPNFMKETYKIFRVRVFFTEYNMYLDLDSINKDVASELIRVYLSNRLSEEKLETAMNDLGEHGMVLKPKYNYEV